MLSKKIETMNTQDKISKAKEVLKKYGYYTDNLWTIEDVKSKYLCTDEQAYGVLDGALKNEATMEQIWSAIDIHSESENLGKFKENYFLINGFFKDDKSEFSGYLVYEYDGVEDEFALDDDNIFYYDLSENDIIEAIEKGWETSLDFVITGYEKIIE